MRGCEEVVVVDVAGAFPKSAAWTSAVQKWIPTKSTLRAPDLLRI
jgi:hypothetical protein